jgi:hypothetical protein
MNRIKLSSIVIAMVLCVAIVLASAPEKYGKELTLKKTTDIADILANPDDYDGKRVLVEGKVIDVCSMMGCWIKIDAGEGVDPITFKVDDRVIIFPVEAKGKTARAEGVVSVETMTQEQLIARAKHEAEENDTLDSFDPSTITGPKTVVRIMGEGAVIED